jgi:hypothetical protein
MLGVTFFGIFLTPVFYVVIRKIVEHREKKSSMQAADKSDLPAGGTASEGAPLDKL